MGIEPTYSAWKADVLPLNYTRNVVPMVGVEPTLPKEHDFESCASANSATSALYVKEVPGFEPGNKGFADLGLTTWLYLQKRKEKRTTRLELATPTLARSCSTN